MAESPVPSESRIERLEIRIDALERRLARLEQRGPDIAAGTAEAPASTGAPVGVVPPSTPAARATDAADLPATLSLVGRTFIVFGGAYLVRALTESGRLQSGAGVVLGLVYALAWLGAADRAAARSRAFSAQFHGVAAVLIALPLLWEASTRFGFLSAPASAAALALVTGLALVVAWRRRLQALAGAATLGAIGVAVLCIGGLGAVLPFAVVLVLLGVATLWLGYDRDWYWLRWVTAVVANLVLLGLTSRALGPEPRDPPETVVAVLLFMLAAYLVSFAARTLVRGRLLIVFEAVQTVFALMIGLGGAVAVTRASGTGALPLGAATLAIGAGCYGVAFAFVGRRQGLGSNFYFYATLALVLTLSGCAMLMGGPALGVACALLACVVSWAGWRLSRTALTLHGAVYAAGACLASGLLGACAAALLAGTGSAWPAVSVAGWAALFATAAALAIPRPAEVDAPGWLAAVPRLAIATLLVTGAGGAIVTVLAPALAGVPPDPGRLATLRTAVISVAAMALALATRHSRTAELGWLLYPALLFGGVKLLLDDFRHSQAATLFLALALYGIALVAAPRLAKPTTARQTAEQ